MKRKLFILSLLVVIGTQMFATDRDDMKYIDKLYETKEYNMATEELKVFVNKYPESSYKKTALERLAKTLYIDKKYKESIGYFDEYLKLSDLKKHEINEAHYYIARNEIYLKNYNEAKREINLIDKESPKKIDAVYYLGISYYENEDYDKAKKTFKYLMNKPTRSNEALLYISLSSYNNSEYVNSTIYLDEYLKGSTEGKDLELANYMYGMNHYKLGDNEDAIKILTDVENKYPKGKYINDVEYGLLEIYLSENNMEKTVEYYNKSKDGVNKEKANTILGNHYFENNNYETSLKYYELIKDSTNSKVIYGLAYSMFKVGESTENENGEKLIIDSKEYFEKLLGTDLNSEGIYYIAFIDFKNKDYNKVIADLKDCDMSKMKKEYKNNIDLFLGKSYYEAKNYDEARLKYEKAYNKTRKKGDLYQLILIDEKVVDVDGIKIRFQEYKNKFPTDLEYRQKIYLLVGNTHYKGGDIKGAKEVYKEYLKSYNDPKIAENLITILVAEGSYEELVTYLTPQPKTAENRYLMGVGLLGLTQYDKAEKEFESVVAGADATPVQKEKASYNLVESNLANKKYEATINLAKKYLNEVSYTKYRNEVMDNEGLANFRLEKYGRAREIFTELGKNKEYYDYSKFQIAESYYNEGKYDIAYKNYNELYLENKVGKYATQSLYWGINVLYSQDKYKDVIDKSKEFNVEYPKSEYTIDVNLYRADAYLKLNDTKNSAITYTEIYGKTSDEKVKDKVAKELTGLYYNTNDFNNANVWKEKIIDLDEKTYFSALIYEKEGKMDLATAEYKKLIKNDKYGSKSNFNLATYYYNEKNYDEAKIYYENLLAVEEGPYKDTATYQVGQIYFMKEDYDKALRNFMKVELLYENSSFKEPAKLKIAEIYEKQGESEKAKKTYEEFYSVYPKSKYKSLILEKLLVMNFNEDKVVEAKKYYDELLVVNKNVAETYTEYFSDIIAADKAAADKVAADKVAADKVAADKAAADKVAADKAAADKAAADKAAAE